MSVYRTKQFPMTLSYRQGHGLIVSVYKCHYSYSCVLAVDKISTDLQSRAVPLQ